MSLKILIADDSHTDGMILAAIVRKEGHQVVIAYNGAQAVDKFLLEKPDIVLMDALMPVKDGFQAASEIKAMAGDTLVPIIFLTSLKDTTSLVRCLESGGDDFLSKPYNQVIIRAKLNAFARMRAMHATMVDYNQQLLLEQQTAKRVFENVVHLGCLDLPCIRYKLSPLAVFNGDTLLAQRRPDGGLHIFIGDFTGHGLPAAIGAMPLADTFYGMTAKGFGVEEIVSEINRKLNEILPMGVFCCGALAHLDQTNKRLRLWIAGLPDAFLLRGDGTIDRFSSTSLPLGIINSDHYDIQIKEAMMADGERLYLWSDGITEARDPKGNMFGEQRLLAVFDDAKTDDFDAIDAIFQSLSAFIGSAAHEDDLSLVEVCMQEAEPQLQVVHQTLATQTGPTDWHVEVHLGADSLQMLNPLPLLLQSINEVSWLKQMSGQIYTVIAELYANALEHGVLGLSSALKATPEGFNDYYRLRQQRLEALTEGSVRIKITHKVKNEIMLFEMEMQDSGPGFDWREPLHKQVTNPYSGRGTTLIRAIVDQLQYYGSGNHVKASLSFLPPKKSALDG